MSSPLSHLAAVCLIAGTTAFARGAPLPAANPSATPAATCPCPREQAASLPSLSQQIAANERRINEIDTELRRLSPDALQDPSLQAAEIDRRIVQQQQLVTGLDAELGQQQSGKEAQSESQDVQLSQLTQDFQLQLNNLQQKILDQKAVLDNRETELRNTLAETSSELMVTLRTRVAEARARLVELQNQYSALLLAQRGAQQQQLAASQQQRQSQQAATANLEAAKAEARAELQRLEQQRNQLNQQLREAENKSEQLRTERSKLQEANQRLRVELGVSETRSSY